MMQSSGKLTLALLASSLALAYGIWYAYSVMLVALLDEFSWDRSVLAGAFSLFAIVHGFTNPVIGHLCDRVRPGLIMIVGGIALGCALFANATIESPLHLYLYFGGLTSVSVAMCGWAPAVVQVHHRFQHRLGFALGIVSSGIGVGMLVLVPLCQFLIESYGWRTAFRALGMICGGFIVPAAIYLFVTDPARAKKKAQPADTSDADRAGDISLRQAARQSPFWLMVLAFFFGSTCSQTLHVHQVAFLVDHGIAALTAAAVVGVVGVASVFGKTGGGWISDRIDREVVYVSGIVIMVASVAAITIAGHRASVTWAYLYATMLGVGYSATAAIIPAMVSDRFQGRHFGTILGMGLFSSAAGSALGPWMGGYLFDLTGSYHLPFSIAAVFGVGAGLAGWLMRRARLSAIANVGPGASGGIGR